jgi:hypothetical protein
LLRAPNEKTTKQMRGQAANKPQNNRGEKLGTALIVKFGKLIGKKKEV